MKKFISLLLVLMMVLGMAVSVSADEADPSITITNATANVEYTIYKVFDLTHEGTAVAYTYTENGPENASDPLLLALQGEDSPFTLTESSIEGVYNVTSAASAETIATWLKDNENLLSETDSKVAAGAEVVFDGVELGYYYVTSTLGTVVTVDSTVPNVEIEDKNEKPTATKYVKNGNEWTSSNTATIGGTVEYKVEVAVKTGAKNYTLVDTLGDGLTYVANSINVTGATLGTDYTFTASGNNLQVAFDNEFLAGKAGQTLTVTYSATLDADATVGGNGNVNTVYLQFGDTVEGKTPKTVESSVTTYTYEFDIVKTDSNKNLLDGAEFQLYVKGSDVPVALVNNEDGTYRVAVESADTSIDTIVVTDGFVTVSGLGNGEYELVETYAPAGYNMLTAPEDFEIEDASWKATFENDEYVSGGVHVINNTGSELPSTGGMGTTMFYVIGGMMMIGAAVLLITKKRMY